MSGPVAVSGMVLGTIPFPLLFIAPDLKEWTISEIFQFFTPCL
jgi:hypothetical protein